MFTEFLDKCKVFPIYHDSSFTHKTIIERESEWLCQKKKKKKELYWHGDYIEKKIIFPKQKFSNYHGMRNQTLHLQ